MRLCQFVNWNIQFHRRVDAVIYFKPIVQEITKSRTTDHVRAMLAGLYCTYALVGQRELWTWETKVAVVTLTYFIEKSQYKWNLYKNMFSLNQLKIVTIYVKWSEVAAVGQTFRSISSQDGLQLLNVLFTHKLPPSTDHSRECDSTRSLTP